MKQFKRVVDWKWLKKRNRKSRRSKFHEGCEGKGRRVHSFARYTCRAQWIVKSEGGCLIKQSQHAGRNEFIGNWNHSSFISLIRTCRKRRVIDSWLPNQNLVGGAFLQSKSSHSTVSPHTKPKGGMLRESHKNYKRRCNSMGKILFRKTASLWKDPITLTRARAKSIFWWCQEAGTKETQGRPVNGSRAKYWKQRRP